MSPYKVAVVILIEKYNRIGLKHGDAVNKGVLLECKYMVN